jgi:glycosyltransferase involved in cell wall biosynthesis
LIIGEGSIEQDLKGLCNTLGISEKVKFTGRVPFNEINKYYNMLDVLVNISEYESFGVSVIEAMACEKPVIVSNVGGLKEIVINDQVGLKVEIGSIDQTAKAIEELVSNQTTCEQIGKNGRAHVTENYNWQANLKKMIVSYELLIKDQKTQNK